MSAANTPAHHYLDTESFKGVCAKELKRIKNNCATSNKNKNSLADKLMGKKANAKLDGMKKKLGDNAPQSQWVTRAMCVAVLRKTLATSGFSKQYEPL